MLYWILRFIFNCILNLFFREIKVRGAHFIPDKGPVLFVVAPHHNQFLDPILLITNQSRKISFLTAMKSMHRKFIGAVARSLEAIPVVRGQDLTFQPAGSISISNSFIKEDGDQKVISITGKDTLFKTQLTVRSTISISNIPNSTFLIVNIIDDTHLEIKQPEKDIDVELFSKDDGQSLYFDFKVIPHVDQKEMFSFVTDKLRDGGAVGIFPEGGSHDQSTFLPLKAGAAIMALQAMSQYENLNVRIVPVGLNYFHPHRFRSRAVVEFGEPIQIHPELVHMFKAGGKSKKESCQDLLEDIHFRLKNITVTAPDYETLMIIQTARRLYRPEDQKLTTPQICELNRRFLHGYVKYKDDERIISLSTRLSNYNKLLRGYGLRDHQVKRTQMGSSNALQTLFIRLLMILFLAVFFLPGLVLGFPIILITDHISKQKQKEALRSSSVKINARDVISTWKLLVALVVSPITYLIEAGLLTILLTVPLSSLSPEVVTQVHPALIFVLLFVLIIPLTVLLSIYTFEVGLDLVKSLKPVFIAITFSKKFVEDLREIRYELEKDLVAVSLELGHFHSSNPRFDMISSRDLLGSSSGTLGSGEDLFTKTSLPKGIDVSSLEGVSEEKEEEEVDAYQMVYQSWARRFDSREEDEDEGFSKRYLAGIGVVRSKSK